MATAAKQQTTRVRGSSASASSSTSPITTTKLQSSVSATVTKTNQTSGHNLSGRSPSPSQKQQQQQQNYIETDEDIATIAKQISDHAEAIYQTWKARGLAPTEILNCHTGTSEAFGKVLTPSSNRNSLESPVAEILAQAPDMSNNNLEKLVSSFVNEDKARQQAARKNSGGSNILTSGTIKDALRKFESNSTPSGYVKPNFLIRNTTSSKSTASSAATTPTKTGSASSSPTSASTQLSKSVPDVLIDSIQAKQMPKTNVAKTPSSSPIVLTSSAIITSSSVSNNSSNNSSISINSSSKNAPNSNSVSSHNHSVSTNVKKPQTPAKPANLINHTPSWPLKNRLNIGATNTSTLTTTQSTSIGNGIGVIGGTIKNDIKDRGTDRIIDGTNKSIKTIDTGAKKSADLLDEVSREEERLINALKTGVILNNNDKLPEVITSTLNDKTDRTNNSWTKPDVSTTSSISSLPVTIAVATKNGTSTASPSLSLPSSSSTSSSSSSASQVVMTKNTSNISPKYPQGSNNSSWNDDTTTIITPMISTTSSSVIATTNSTAPVHQAIGQNLNKIEGMSPSSAPAPSKIKLRPKNDAAVPHPETKNSNSHNNHVNSRNNIINPVRPFLTRGSVAERVLMFEKCPDVKAPLRNINREPSKISTKPLVKPEHQSHTTLQRHIRSSSKNVYIPRFHFPHGKPLPTIAMETTLQRLVSAFDSFPNNQVTKDDLPHILKICGLPFYWRMPLIACAQHATSGLVDGYRFIDFWKQMSVYCHDTTSRFVYILSRGQRSRPYILHEDLAPLVQDVVDTHPGLAFLKEATEFHSRYVHTVIARIFYTVNRCWSGKITVPELRRSNLLQVIQLLEEEEDINQIMAFFSYEHFYVIYCKFWELDRDHDLFIDQNDLARHNDHALSTRIIERIFSGCVTRGGRTRITGPHGPKMSYTDFVWFLLSEEDKNNPTAIEYWFRCMDLDGDGILSMYELEYFYEEQQQRMEAIGIETLPFEDCLCQMLDMIKPVKDGCITLSDLKRCRMTPIFFDTFFNLEKYLEHEQRDPFATQRDNDDMSDWDRYAAQEYELLVAEEGGDTQGSYDEEDDDYESNIDILESQLDDMSNMINEW